MSESESDSGSEHGWVPSTGQSSHLTVEVILARSWGGEENAQ